jgi:predicted NBD/HSP70 family sugar kinase
MDPLYLGIDLHNTKTYAVLIDKAGVIIDERQIRTDDTSKYLKEVVPIETFSVLGSQPQLAIHVRSALGVRGMSGTGTPKGTQSDLICCGED